MSLVADGGVRKVGLRKVRGVVAGDTMERSKINDEVRELRVKKKEWKEGVWDW